MATAEPAAPGVPEPRQNRRSISLHVLLAAGLFVLIQTFSLLAPILLSFLLILLISLSLHPVISRLRAWPGGRKGATALLATGLVVVIGLTGWACFVPMRLSLTGLAETMPAYWERLQKPLIRMEQKAVRSEERLQAEVTTEIDDAATAAGEPVKPRPVAEPAPAPAEEPGSIRSGLSDMLEGVAARFTEVAFDAAQIVFVLVTVFFGVISTLMNPAPIFGALLSFVPERHHGRAMSILQRIGRFAPRWAAATLLGMLMIGVLVFLLMWPVFGFADALLLGLIAGVLEAIPFMGPVLSSVPALLLAMGQGGMTPLWVALAYVGVQALENNVILPFIMSREMKLNPVAVIFSMLLCVAAFGVLGVVVAAPLVAIVVILHDEIYRRRFLPTTTHADLDRMAREALQMRPTRGSREGDGAARQQPGSLRLFGGPDPLPADFPARGVTRGD